MNEIELNLACAKLDGWKVVHSTYDEIKWRTDLISPGARYKDYCINREKRKLDYFYEQLPQYTNSYSAIIPLIQKLSDDLMHKFCYSLHGWDATSSVTAMINFVKLTPLELSIALLKVSDLYLMKDPPCTCTKTEDKPFLVAHAEWCDVAKYRKGNKVL
jgi:hypothetical protein